jgi:hypothetical protein
MTKLIITEEGVFLTVKDLQKLRGCRSYKTANVEHIAIRKALGKDTKHLTIKEYCDYQKIDFDFIWEFLRGKQSFHK